LEGKWLDLSILTPEKDGFITHIRRVHQATFCQTNEPGRRMTATVAHADDAAIRQKILGYWSTGRHVFLFKNDGNALMMGGTSNMKWAVHNGMYYEGGDQGEINTNTQGYKILSLTSTRFVTDRGEDGIYTWKREAVK
jgi:hypothetical protein